MMVLIIMATTNYDHDDDDDDDDDDGDYDDYDDYDDDDDDDDEGLLGPRSGHTSWLPSGWRLTPTPTW